MRPNCGIDLNSANTELLGSVLLGTAYAAQKHLIPIPPSSRDGVMFDVTTGKIEAAVPRLIDESGRVERGVPRSGSGYLYLQCVH